MLGARIAHSVVFRRPQLGLRTPRVVLNHLRSNVRVRRIGTTPAGARTNKVRRLATTGIAVGVGTGVAALAATTVPVFEAQGDNNSSSTGSGNWKLAFIIYYRLMLLWFHSLIFHFFTTTRTQHHHTDTTDTIPC